MDLAPGRFQPPLESEVFMSILDGFRMAKSTRTQAHPMMTIMHYGAIVFSKATLEALDYPPYVQCFFKDESGEFAIRPCKQADEESTRFYTGAKNNKSRVRWNKRQIANWFKGYTEPRIGKNENFRVTGQYYEEDNAVIFNLHNAVPTAPTVPTVPTKR